ncbi:ATP cone domain-containing protein, partial [Candidatus Gracilibacteria bacterium]|nr:ATP cone domain-containing protein [Candidatus Gracilibacteria bacterium]
MIPFDISRIERAIEKAAESVGVIDMSCVDEIVDGVMNRMYSTSTAEGIYDVESIQDAVEQELMDQGQFAMAKHFILYRNNRTKLRQEKKQKLEKKIEKKELKILKTDGKKEAFDIEKVKETYKRVSYGLARVCKFEELEASLKKYLV